jgi:uncharacterized protein (DUF169 family)
MPLAGLGDLIYSRCHVLVENGVVMACEEVQTMWFYAAADYFTDGRTEYVDTD